MAIFATYLRAGHGSEPVWFRGPKTSPKVPVIYGATSGGPNPKLMMTLEKACPPPLKDALTYYILQVPDTLTVPGMVPQNNNSLLQWYTAASSQTPVMND